MVHHTGVQHGSHARMAELLPPGALSGTGAGALTSPIRYAYVEAASLGGGVAMQNQLCRCDPNKGFQNASYTDRTFTHLLSGGHLGPVWPTQCYFFPTEKVGQALVDEIIAKALPTDKQPNRSRVIYNVDMNRPVGMWYDKNSTSLNKFSSTQRITMVIERNNCSSTWRFNEVVTIYPDRKRL